MWNSLVLVLTHNPLFHILTSPQSDFLSLLGSDAGHDRSHRRFLYKESVRKWIRTLVFPFGISKSEEQVRRKI